MLPNAERILLEKNVRSLKYVKIRFLRQNSSQSPVHSNTTFYAFDFTCVDLQTV